MNLFIALLAPAALLVPALAAVPSAPKAELTPPEAAPVAGAERIDTVRGAKVPAARQVRIEQRVIVRIAPPGPAVRQSLVPQAAPLAPSRLQERKMGKCVPIAGIAAVQPKSDSTLLLFMRDRRLVSASLEKACRARDFYSGFYLERSRDGMLCVERDKLHSRAGGNCEISRMRQLVASDD